jgi:polysaccharide export outer membrane protein
VTVTGEAIAGKRVALNPGGERLLDVLAAAGGPRTPVHDTYVQLSRGGVTASIPLATLVEHPAENIYARPGDVLTVVQRPKTFSVFGATGKNAAITFDQDRLTVSEALAKSGGLLDDQADARAVFLFRYEPDAVVKALGQPLASQRPQGVSPVAYRFDLKDPKSYLLAKEFPVRDKDIVFVANAEIQPVYRFFTALQNVTGPVVTGFLTCQNGGC